MGDDVMEKSYYVLVIFIFLIGLFVLNVNVTTTAEVVSSTPLSAQVKGGTNKVPLEVGCIGPENNNLGIRETVIRTYSDGTQKNFTDLCRGKNYLNYYQCSKTQKARIVSCWFMIGKGAVCKEGACVK